MTAGIMFIAGMIFGMLCTFSIMKMLQEGFDAMRKKENAQERDEIDAIHKTENEQDRNKEKGERYEKERGAELEARGYTVEYRGIEKGFNDGGIDLIARKSDEIMLVQCKNWTNIQADQKDIKHFFASYIDYIEEEKPPKEIKVKCRFVCSAGFTDQAVKQIQAYNARGHKFRFVKRKEHLVDTDD
ncbi:MAG: restriction endonuclease [Helicobacteraceae bacterium]|jgi:Holliday junction resolvase-like predicted endonuclease|nr:restriction endonuclease [Helicobacteraceae bacterium]